MQVHQCIRAGNVTVKNQHIRLFLVESARSISQIVPSMIEFEAAGIAHDTMKHISLLVEDGERPPHEHN